MIPFSLLYISDGTTTLNLIDNLSYGVDSLDPVIAPRQRSELSAGGPYLNVVQPLTVNVFGNTPAACWDNLTKLIRLLDQGENWARDIPVACVRIVVQTVTSTIAVGAEILGQADADAPLGSLAPEYEQVGSRGRYVIRNVQLSFLRTGMWEFSVDAAVASAAVANPGIMPIAFSGSNLAYCRLRMTWYKTGATEGGIREGNYAYTLIASDDAKLRLIDSVSFTTPALTTNQADAGADAFGGSVKRFQASTTEITINVNPAWTTPQRRVGIFAAVRNNSATATFYIRGEATDIDNTPNRTPYTTIDTSTALPQVVFLGTCTARYDQSLGIYNVTIYVSASLTSAAQTLDIDYVALICLDDPWTDRVIVTGNTLSASGSLAIPVIEPGSSILRTPYPILTVTNTGGPHAEPYAGDIYLVCTGSEMATLVLTTNGDTFWRLRDGGGAISMVTSVRRTQAYRTPPGESV